MSHYAENSIIIRLKLANKPGTLSNVMQAIATIGANIGAIDIIGTEANAIIRDLTIFTHHPEQVHEIEQQISHMANVEIIHISDRVFLLHIGGKIAIKSKTPINNRDELSMAYTPGVGRVCQAIAEKPEKAFKLTIKRNTVAVVSDGSAVLGLGNIGPYAAMPVMEGKAMLFKDFADIDAFPICLDTQDPEAIIETVKNLAPGFGGINLEDIAAPQCFEIEKRLQEQLNIPVFHDDQHGTAVVLGAAVINALKIVKKAPDSIKVIIVGVGAAGTACANMLSELGIKNIIGCDSKGAIVKTRKDLNPEKQAFAERYNPNQESGSISDVMQGADMFVGLSAPNVISLEDIKRMNTQPMVFAMANPTPEISPKVAGPHVAIMATGRSDYPNQINNVLAFPGIFRGALNCQASRITRNMQLAAAHAIANVIDENALSADYIVPSVFDNTVVPSVAKAVSQAAFDDGVARKRKKRK